MSKRMQLFNKATWQTVNKENKEILEDYVLELRSKKKSDGTIYQYSADIKAFMCYVHDNFDNKSILELKKRDFRRFFIFLEEKSPARINRVQCSIRNLLEFCMEDDDEYEDYDINIMRSIKGLEKNPTREIYFLTDEQIQKLLDYLVENKLYQRALYLALSYESAGRRAEVHQVLKHDFVNSNTTNVVKGKRGKQFTLKYFGKSQEIAELYLEQRGEDDVDSLWVVDHKDGLKPASYETLYNWVMGFRKILLNLVDEDIEFNPHSIRHSALENYSDGTHFTLKEIGKEKLDIKVLKVLANHTSIETTESYLKNKDEELLNNAFNIE